MKLHFYGPGKIRDLTLLLALGVAAGYSAHALQDPSQTAKPAATRMVGAITAIHGNSLTIKTDAGVETTVTVDDSTRLLQTLPGQKDLSSATAIHINDLEVGDRVLARATAGDDGKTYTASTVIAMKQADLAQKHQQEREAWQRSGEGGLVKSVDAAAQTVTVSVMGPGGAKPVTVHATPATITRRYAPDSIEFNDAQPAPFDRIKPGDQLRARGTRSADGAELQADEIVSGTFRNVVATVTAVDPATGTLTVKDLVDKAPVTIRVTHDSQLRKLPPMMAQGLAMRLRNAGGDAADGKTPGGQGGSGYGGGSGMGPNHASAAGGPSAPGGTDSAAGGPAGGGQWRRGGAGSQPGSPSGEAGPGGEQRPRGPADLQQALSRAPIIQLSDLQKGDAVMVVTTEGSPTSPATAVTLLAGVEPMLQASTRGSQSMLSSSWNLNGGAGAGGGDAAQ